MARSIKCKCGERYKVTRRNAGTKGVCDECDRVLYFPDLDDDEDDRGRRRVEELEEVDDDDATAADLDEKEHHKRMVGLPTKSKKVGICFLCEEEGKGKFYTFFAAFLENVDSKHDYWSGQTTVRTTYSNMHKTGLFLCRECAVGAWRRKYLLQVILWSLPMFFFFFLGIVMGVSGNAGTRTAMIPMFLVGVIFLCILLAPLYWMLNPSLERETMERICIGLSKGHKSDEGDTFFTTSEFRETFGRHPEENMG